MVDAGTLFGGIGVILSVPSTLLAWQDWSTRRTAASVVDARDRAPTPQPAAVAALRPAPPPRAPTAFMPPPPTLPPVVRPHTDVHLRTTVKLGEPLSIWRRVLAAAIDGYGVLVVAALLAAGIADPIVDEDAFGAAYGLFIVIGALVLAALNQSARSPGKLLVGGTLVRHSTRSEPVSFGRSLVRVLVGGTLGLLSVAFVLGASRRSLHDRLTDTEVIRSR